MLPTAAGWLFPLLAVAAGIVRCVVSIPQHMQFQLNDERVEAVYAPELRMNAKGGDLQNGDPLVLWPCGPQMHELFKISDGEHLIRLVKDSEMCLQAEGGVLTDTKIIVWPCAHFGRVEDHEELVFEDGRIKVKNHRHMCLNVKGGYIASGTELVLFPCHNEDGHPHELFTFDNGLIKSTVSPLLHLNIKGGDIKGGSEVLLYHCQPAPHEEFEFDSSMNVIRLIHQNHMCVNAEGGLWAGHRLVIWPCSTGEDAPADNEQFKHDPETNMIYSVVEPHLGFNAKGGAMEAGAEVVLWQLKEDL